MSWPQWPTAGQPPAPAVPAVLNPNNPVINSAPAVAPPGLQYTPEQWAQLQQQNWNQWAQWQQQYQQWHQQYGAEYQKSINALAQASQQPSMSLPNVAVPPPLPTEGNPPLPTEDPPPLVPSYSTMPPSYNTTPAPPIQPMQHEMGHQPKSWLNQRNTRFNNNENKNPSFKRGYDQGGNEPKRPMNKPNWPNQPPPLMQIVVQKPAAPVKENIEELSEAEKKFDKQFAEWEAQFNKWKEQNSEHPDKEQYREYEKKWENWRSQLLERREQMKRKRLGLSCESPNRGRPAQPQQTIPQNFHQPPPLFNKDVVSKQGLLPTPPNSNTTFTKPPPNLNDEPLKFKQNKQFPEGDEGTSDFLKASASEGIPGLDLVADDAINETEGVAGTEANAEGKEPPDFEAISKGINNILGDQKLMNMLSLVSQNQNVSQNDNTINTLPKIRDTSNSAEPFQSHYPDQSNQSYEEHSNHSEAYAQRELPNNFDDQTRSSFTMTHNEHESNNFGRNPPRFDQNYQFGNRFDNFDKGNRFGNPDNDSMNRSKFNRNDFQNDRQFGGPRMDEFDRFGPSGDQNNRRNNFGSNIDRNVDRFGLNNDRDFPQDRFGSNRGNDNRFGNQPERFPPKQDRFGQNEEEFTSNPNRFAPSENRFGSDDGGFGLNDLRFNSHPDRFGANKDRRVPNQDRYEPNQERFGQAQNRFGPPGRFPSNQNRFPASEDKFSGNQRNFAPKSDFGNKDEFRGSDRFGGRDDGNRPFNPEANRSFPPKVELQAMGPKGNDFNHRSYEMDDYNQDEDYDHYYDENQDEYDEAENAPDFNKDDPWMEADEYEQHNFKSKPPTIESAEVAQEASIESILKPTNVIDYEHKSIKSSEPEILIEPIYMFDYRHKSINRIPLPQRPKWLAEAVRNIREFDPPVVRPYELPHLRRYPPPVDSWRKDRYADEHWSPHNKRSYNENRPPFEAKRPAHEDSKFDKEWSPLSDGDWDKDAGDEKESHQEVCRFPAFKNDKRIGVSEEKRNSDCNFAKQRYSDDITSKSFEAGKFNKNDNSSNNKCKTVISIEDLISPPGRFSRPPRIVIILRGPPGSGKTYLAKLIKDKEVENGGSTPRILSLDDYFMVEQEREVTEDGKRVKIKDMVYEYEAEMEESYRLSLIKSFKKTITDGYFSFIIVDNVNDKVKYFGEMWSFAKQNGFQVYICQLDLDVQTCSKRNIHGRSEEDIKNCVDNWEPTPSHHPTLDATGLLQLASIPEVEMEEVNSPESDMCDENDGAEDQVARSKWDNFDCSVLNLAKLDGVSKPLRPSRTMEEYLQLDTEWAPIDKPTKPGQKRVRWADLEEQKQQEKMRAIGFVVGQTNWDRMMDPTGGSSALTQTKYIERTGRYRVDQK